MFCFEVIPHDFGLARPPLLDNIDLIKSKTDLKSKSLIQC